ncbi:MAG: bifunctional oligoribonuclease/PAP phosphatase NrnA [Candidatus Rokubacteria bacterium]|nr:bifunctional oligoribonuclease/PAP phosphatase NrnA [Candidatus Rokubacteria bacterium]
MSDQELSVPSELRALLGRPTGDVLLLGHAQPDGDQLGSLLGLGLALGEAGWPVTFAGPHAVPEPLRFLPGSALFQQWTTPRGPFHLVIVCDCPDPRRTGGLLEGARGPATRVVNIDHHPDNARYGTVNWIHVGASAAGEMVYDLIVALGLKLTPQVATNLFTAIHTDTGSFRYTNASAKAFRTAAELVARGADPARIAAQLYEARGPESLGLLGRLLQQIQVSPDGLVAWLALPAGSVPEAFLQAEDLVSYPRSIASAKVGLVLRETEGRHVKVSLRGKGEVPVNAIAARFGGGGHSNAAGCTVEGSLDEVTARILSAVSEALGRPAR